MKEYQRIVKKTFRYARWETPKSRVDLQELDDMGKEGWELVSIFQRESDLIVTYVFKQEIRDVDTM